jgi:hypothetical protein
LLFVQAAGASLAVAQPTDEDEASPDDIAEPVPPAEEPAEGDPAAEVEEVVAEEIGGPEIDRGEGITEVGYESGFFVKAAGGKYTLRLGGALQPFVTMTRVSGPADWQNAASIRRARLVLDGNLHGKDLLYRFHVGFDRGMAGIKDAYFDVALGEKVWLRAGQWKRPFSRQRLTSYTKLELTERAITDAAFGAGRDIGLAIRNDYEKSTDIEWVVGVFNGTGDTAQLTGTVETDPVTGDGTITGGTFTSVPLKFMPAFVGRIGLNDGGVKGYSEADLEGGPLRWGAAASVWMEAELDDDDASSQRVNLDYIVKASGFSTTGGFYAMTTQTGPKPLSSQELSFVGFHLQTGYMVKPNVQAGARYALVDGRLDDAKDAQEITVGGTYFGHGNEARVSGAVRFIKVGDATFTDTLRFELSAIVGW